MAGQPRPAILAAIAGGTVVLLGLVAVAVLVLTRPASTMTVSGVLTLAPGNSVSNGTVCQGKGGYSDIAGGAQVVVRDGSGKSIAVGQLDAGEDAGSHACVFPFTVPQVPDSGGVYSVEVANRGQISFTKATAQQVGLSLG